MGLEQYLPSWFLDYLSPIVLMAGGLIALLIVAMYLKDKESLSYKVCVALGFALGVVIVLIALIQGFKANTYTLVLIAIAAFTLMIRPVREIHMAVLFGLLAMVLVYLALGNLTGDLSFLSTGWPRIIIAFIVGGLVYALLNFAEALVKLFGKFFNCWPVLLVIGLICIVESVCQLMGYGSVFDLINNIPWNSMVPTQ